MFGLFRKKTQLEQLIAKDGLEYATDRFSEIIAKQLPNRDIAYQFILEELEAASMGDAKAKAFAANSGIPASAYKGSLDNSIPEVDGPGGPQQLLLGMAIELSENKNLMVDFRCKVDEKIMKKFSFGKFSKDVQSSQFNPDKASAGEDSWSQTLSNWADSVGLEKLRWEVQPRNRDGGFWVGFPRDQQGMLKLEGLNIQRLGLTNLPKEIGKLQNLKKIWAAENKITNFPKEICDLSLLEEIDFEDNELTAVPDEIGNLTRLRTLNLKSNKISYVPESIKRLRRLERLDLRSQPVGLGLATTPLTDAQVGAIASLGDAVRW